MTTRPSNCAKCSHHITHGIRNEIALLRLGSSMLGKLWRHYEREQAVLEAFAAALPILRNPFTPTNAKESAISRLGTLLQRAPYWTQVENALLSTLYVWPLLVCPSDGAAVSLPIALEVYFDGANDAAIVGDTRISTDEWRASFEKVGPCGEASLARKTWAFWSPVLSGNRDAQRRGRFHNGECNSWGLCRGYRHHRGEHRSICRAVGARSPPW
jgi:hypothetical protein